jgi:ABC-type enterochelin transport system ATPase subunit
MKKVKITIAALLISSVGYSQRVLNDSITKQIAYIESVNTVEDMIEWMRWDIKTGAVQAEVGQSYVESLLSLLSRLEDINAGYISEPFAIDCENCDEID